MIFSDLPAAGLSPAIPAGSSGLIIDSGSAGGDVTHSVEFRVGETTAISTVPEQLLRPSQRSAGPESAPAPVTYEETGAKPARPAAPVTPGAESRVSAPAAAAASAFQGWKFLVPLMVHRMFFSIRRPMHIQTSLSVDRLHQIFVEVLNGGSSINKLLAVSSSYTRNARWAARRTSGDESVAVCQPKGLVTFGFGRSKRLLNISGDTIVLTTTPSGRDRVVASIGVGVFTTVFGFLFAFPNQVAYARAVVKRWRTEDPALLIRMPWSITRLVIWAICLVVFLAVVL